MSETVDEWARRYAARSGVTVEWLKAQGREPRECSCGEDGCEGFQMVHVPEDLYDQP